MFNPLHKKILIMALHAGELMMKSGAEIYRVEDTITRICKSCKINYVEVFATSTGIFISLDDGSPVSDMHTFIKRIRGTGIDLEKISRINHFSRVFTTTDLSVDAALKELKEIAAIRPYPLALRLLGASMVSSFFCLIWGGNVLDFISTFIIGAFSYAMSIFLDRIEVNPFVRGFACCALATAMALLFFSIGLGSQLNAVIIGSIMIFLPGVALTNGVRDTLSGDMLAGLAKGVEAVMVAISLAIGAGFVLKAWEFFGGMLP